MAFAMMIAHGADGQNADNLPEDEEGAVQRNLEEHREAVLGRLLTPVIIIGGILIGWFTPTEAAVVAIIYALFLGLLYKDLKLRDLPGIFWTSIRQTISLLFIIAAAGFFGWLTIHQRIPDQIISKPDHHERHPFRASSPWLSSSC